MIRVLICDDQRVVAEGLQAILSTAASIEVVGKAHNGAEAIQLTSTKLPDVVLMDLNMPRVNGVQATREIRQRFPQVRVLVLTTYDTDEWVFESIRAGASGYLLKDAPRDILIAAIEGTAEGQTHVDSAVAGRLFNHFAHSTPPEESPLLARLTDRELQVLSCLGKGMNNAKLAEKLNMAEGTVRNNVSNILSKLELSDRTQAALFALRNGLSDLNQERS